MHIHCHLHHGVHSHLHGMYARGVCAIKHSSYYPACACAARGKVISRGCRWCPGGGVYKSTLFLEPIFYLSLSEVYFNTDKLLIKFNGLWYSLPARQVFVAIANPDTLSPETQTLHQALNRNQRLQTTPLR